MKIVKYREEGITLGYLPADLIYDLQDITETQILYDGKLDRDALTEAIRDLIVQTKAKPS